MIASTLFGQWTSRRPWRVMLVVLFAAASTFIPKVAKACDDYEEVHYLRSEYDYNTDCWMAIYQIQYWHWSDSYDQYVLSWTEEYQEVEYCFDDGGGSGGGCGGTSCGTCGPNMFTVYDGNARREIKEMFVPGAVGEPFAWKRFHNTMMRDGIDPFGRAGSWRHSWQYELMRMPATAETAERMLVTLPSGVRRFFSQQGTSGEWLAAARFGDRLIETEYGFEAVTESGRRLRFFREGTIRAEDERYEMRELVDRFGTVTHLEYDKTGYLTRVRDLTGKSLDLTYENVPFRKGVFHLIGTLSGNAANGPIELDIPASLRKRVVHVRVSAEKSETLSLQNILLFGSGRAEPLPTVPVGNAPDVALLGDPRAERTFHAAARSTNRFGVTSRSGDLPEMVRIIGPRGSRGWEVARVEAMELVPAERRVLTKVRGSNGDSVSYQYEVIVDRQTTREFVGLTGAVYLDGTRAVYRYQFPIAYQRPLLTECDDPRYKGEAKRIAYTYNTEMDAGMIRQEINPATGGVYATLQVDPQDPLKRTVFYSDLRTVVFKFGEHSAGRPVEQIDSLGRRMTYEYADNGEGPLTVQTDHAGRRKEYFYDAQGRVEREVFNGSEKWRFYRDEKGRVVRKIEAGRHETAYEYDHNGRLAKQTSPNGTVRVFGHDALGRVTKTTDKQGRPLYIAYNDRGLRTSISDDAGNAMTFKYDERDRVIEKTDPLGRIHHVDRNSRGLVTRLVLPDEAGRNYEYDKYGRKVAETDEIGRKRAWEFDELGRVVKETDASGGVTKYDFSTLPQGCSSCSTANRPSAIAHPDGRLTRFLYDNEGRILARTENTGTSEEATTTFEYDSDDRVVSATDPLGGITRHTYDANGHLATTVDPVGGVTKYQHDALGRRTRMTDALGRSTHWTHDERGNVVTVIQPSGAKTVNAYDAADRVIQATDDAGRVTRYDYDQAGRLVVVTDPENRTTRFSYDRAGQRTATVFPDGKRQTWTYDVMGRLIETESSYGLVTRRKYDVRDRLLEVTDSLDGKTRHSYDAAGRRLSTTDGLGRTIRWTYDTLNRRIATERPDGTILRNEYDANGRMIASVDASGKKSKYAYNLSGQLAAFTDSKGNSYRFFYDKRSRKVVMVHPDGLQETWLYDHAQKLVGYVNRAGQRKTVTYNAAGQPLSETWGQAPQPPDDVTVPAIPSQITYSYDAAGHLESVNNGEVTLRYDYDSVGRLLSETTDVSALVPGLTPHTVSYRYDRSGRRNSLVYPDGAVTTLSYDGTGRLAEIKDGGGRALATYEYDPAGRRVKIVRDNALETRYEYDSVGQLVDVKHQNGRQVLASSRYRLDELGRRIGQIREDGLAEAYNYDAMGQIIQARYQVGPNPKASVAVDYEYDSVGNRVVMQESSTDPSNADALIRTTYAANILNQYTRIETISSRNSTVETATLTYDANGNLVGDGKRNYRYDALNRLIGVDPVVLGPGAVRADFGYDPRNRCVVRTFYVYESGRWTTQPNESLVLVYDERWNLVADRKVDGSFQTRYIYGLHVDELLASISGRGKTYQLSDGIGNVMAVADHRGHVLSRNRYDVFGRPDALDAGYRKQGSTGGKARQMFGAREWLEAVGLSDHRHRYYSPSLGRWLSQDPIGLRGGRNLYSMVNNAPVNFVDRYGLYLELWYGNHPVEVPFYDPYHSKLWLVTDENSFVSASSFPFKLAKSKTEPGENPCAQLWFIATGAGGPAEELVAEFNRVRDASEILENPSLVRTFGSHSEATSFLHSVKLRNDNMSYNFQNTSLEYEAIPGASYTAWDEWDEFNSNSYVSGLLISYGHTPPPPGVSVPGYTKPVPSFVFTMAFLSTADLKVEWDKHYP